MLIRNIRSRDICSLQDTLSQHVQSVDSSTKLTQHLPDSQLKRAKQAHKVYKEAITQFEQTVNSDDYLKVWLSYPIINYVDYIEEHQIGSIIHSISDYHNNKHKLFPPSGLSETVYNLLLSGF